MKRVQWAYCGVAPGKDLAAWARREARAALRANRRINDAEFGYSPSTGAVGVRWSEDQTFAVLNVHYPMYGRDDVVSDWVSVGRGDIAPSDAMPSAS